MWRAIHYTALGYPASPSEDDVAAYGAFFGSLQSVLPCESCANNYRRHLGDLPIEPFLHAGRLFEWTVHLHNIVNRELGKARFDWTPDEARSALLPPKEASQAKEASHHLVVAALSVLFAAVLAALIALLVYRSVSRSRR
jgi:hypothetical protein